MKFNDNSEAAKDAICNNHSEFPKDAILKVLSGESDELIF